MYSRKYIRSPVAVTAQMERISPTASSIPLSTPSRVEERSVNLPPDYTGMAFSGSGKSSSLQNPGDYPETQITPFQGEGPSFQDEHLESLTEEILLPVPEDEEPSLPIPPDGMPMLPTEPQEDGGMTEPLAEDLPPVKTAPPPTSPRQEVSPSDMPTHTAPTSPAQAVPLLTSELLRSLTLEDLLLFWMLLMLTVSSQEDQIYLLLGLLLFQR